MALLRWRRPPLGGGGALLLAAALGAPPLPPAAGQERADLQLASFDEAWRVIHETHFDTTFNGVDWLALRDSLRPRAAGVTRDSVRRLLGAMLARLNQSHFALIPEEMADSPTGGAGAGTAGLDVRLLDGRIVVTQVDAGGPADRAGVRPGWVLVAVDTNRVDSLLARLEARPARYSLALRAAGAVGGWLQGEPGSAVSLQLLDGGDRAVHLALRRGDAIGEPVKFGDFPALYARFDARRAGRPAEAPEAQVGVIWFSTWMVPLMRQVDSALDAFRGAGGIVLDLRGNRGGVGAMITGVAGHFTERRDTLGLLRARTATLAFVANPRRVSPDGRSVRPFAGPVAILVDQLSGSASEVFAGGMQAIHRARVFGATSVGGVLPAHWNRLPNGDVLYHAIADFVTAEGVVLEGRGVIPDEPVALTRADLLAGRDPVLEAALHWIAAARSAHPKGGLP